MVLGHRRRLALHRTGKANPEPLHRKLRRQFPGLVCQRVVVLILGRCSRIDHHLEGGLQSSQTTIIAGQYHVERARHENSVGKTEPHKSTVQPYDSPEKWGKLGLMLIVIGGVLLIIYGYFAICKWRKKKFLCKISFFCINTPTLREVSTV